MVAQAAADEAAVGQRIHDLIAEVDGVRYLIDIKAADPKRDHRCQLAAYRNAWFRVENDELVRMEPVDKCATAATNQAKP